MRALDGVELSEELRYCLLRLLERLPPCSYASAASYCVGPRSAQRVASEFLTGASRDAISSPRSINCVVIGARIALISLSISTAASWAALTAG